MLLTPNPWVTNSISAGCNFYGLNTRINSIFWKAVSLLAADGYDFYGSFDLYQLSNSLSLKFTDFATLGRAQQNVLNIYCLSKLAQVGKTTLFSSGGGNRPVKNSHYLSEIKS